MLEKLVRAERETKPSQIGGLHQDHSSCRYLEDIVESDLNYYRIMCSNSIRRKRTWGLRHSQPRKKGEEEDVTETAKKQCEIKPWRNRPGCTEWMGDLGVTTISKRWINWSEPRAKPNPAKLWDHIRTIQHAVTWRTSWTETWASDVQRRSAVLVLV